MRNYLAYIFYLYIEGILHVVLCVLSGLTVTSPRRREGGGGGAGCFAYCVLVLRFVTVFVCLSVWTTTESSSKSWLLPTTTRWPLLILSVIRRWSVANCLLLSSLYVGILFLILVL